MRPKALLPLVLLALTAAGVSAQTIEDSVMMRKNSLCTAVLYSNDRWESYWEGPLKRVNGNIGRITTQSVSGMVDYGVTDRLNVIAALPYVWAAASQGVLHGVSGWQDLTVAAKFNLLETDFTHSGSLRTIVAVAAGTPIGDYTPDYYPLSLGSASRRLSGRLTLSFRAKRGWFLDGTSAYTWRDNVTLDRASYYTDGQLFFSDQVAMPDVFDYTVSAGYDRPGLHIPVSFSQQITRGGGDIRRQDTPFVSNRMNYSKVDALVTYDLPMMKNLSVRAAGSYIVQGRNVGQATTVAAGLLYTFHFGS
jgi:hypothetical protein